MVGTRKGAEARKESTRGRRARAEREDIGQTLPEGQTTGRTEVPMERNTGVDMGEQVLQVLATRLNEIEGRLRMDM